MLKFFSYAPSAKNFFNTYTGCANILTNGRTEQ
jgi:hypothetical protein